jgi:GTP-binding protein HflX
VVINKADAADPLALARLRRREPNSVVVSARTGEGLAELLAVIERDLPRIDREVRLLLPYDRGDLVARVHDQGEVLKLEHTGEGTELHARVPESLTGEIERYLVEPSTT